MITIDFSLLSGGEQLVLSRLVTKEQNGKELNAKEYQFISDMRSREMGRLKFRYRKTNQKSFQTN